MKAGTVGIDLAKNVFQLHVSDKRGGKIFNKKVSRKDLVSTIDKLDKEEDFLVAMEACGGSTMSPGHSVPRDIKPESCLPNERISSEIHYRPGRKAWKDKPQRATKSYCLAAKNVILLGK